MSPLFLIGIFAAAGIAITSEGNTKVKEPSSGDPYPVSDDPDFPARALSIGQAKAILQGFQDKNLITIANFDGDFVTMGSSIDGVAFHYAVDNKPRPIAHVDVRFAVLLVRLAFFLKDNHSAVVINHLGIYPGDPKRPGDCHNHGRAMDFVGIQAADGSIFNVLKDWGQQPRNYPPNADPMKYRLTNGQKGYMLFLSLYSFLTSQAADRTDQYVANYPQGPTVIGDHGYIIHPDHPNSPNSPNLNQMHQNHVHFQIGPTNIG